MVKKQLQKIKNASLAWMVWYVACVACKEEPKIILSPQADSAFSELYKKSVLAHAERLGCLATNGRRVVEANQVGYQVVARDGTSGASYSSSCPQGTVHTHVFPDSAGSIDSLFSRGDEFSQSKGLTYCVVYSPHEVRCKNDSWEGVINYGPRRELEERPSR